MVPIRRHASHWRAYVAAGIAAILIALIANAAICPGSSSGESVSQSNGRDEGTHAQTKKNPPPTPAPVTGVLSGQKKSACAGAQPGEDDNLCYQRRSSEASERQADQATSANAWAARQFVLGIVGATLILATLAYTARGIWLAERALTRVERAFVFVDSFEHNVVGDALSIMPVWRNSGATPAARAIMRGAWKVFPAPLSEHYHFPDLDKDGNEAEKFSEITPIFIGPDSARFGESSMIPLSIIELVANKKAYVYLWGWVEYDDILSRSRHRTEYCNQFFVVHFTPKCKESESVLVARFTNHWEHSGADENCMKKTTPWPGNRA